MDISSQGRRKALRWSMMGTQQGTFNIGKFISERMVFVYPLGLLNSVYTLLTGTHIMKVSYY